MGRVDGYDHAVGDHCGSSSLRNLAAFYGWGFEARAGYDEATCFGLAEGLGFTYLDLPESPWRAFFGRPMWLERAFFENLRIDVAEREGDPFPAAWADVRRRIDEGHPVLVFTDLYYLDYFDTSTHFAPHSLLVVGYESASGDPLPEGEAPDAGTAAVDPGDPDAETAAVDPGDPDAATASGDPGGVVHLSDSEFEAVRTLPVARLRAAMTSDHVVPLENRRLSVVDPDPGRGFEAAARGAIERTARYVLDPAASDRPVGPGTHGIEGIREFGTDLPAFVELPDPRWAVRFAYQNVERRGTGGGAFRRLYADFLGTAAGRIPELPDDVDERMGAIADAWTDVGEDLRAISECEDDDEMLAGLETAREEVLAIADREETLFAELGEALETGPGR